MSKKVLILSTSPRKGGNSDLLCDEFMRGAKESGNDVEKIFIAQKKINYCKAVEYVILLINVFKKMIWQKFLIKWFLLM